MSYEKLIQQKAILEEVNTINEYDQLNFKNNLQYYKEGSLEKVTAAIIGKNGDIQTNMIDSIMEQLRNNAADYKEEASFYEEIYDSPDIDTIPVSTRVHNMGLIDKIRPQYLSQYVLDMSIIIDKFLSGKLSKETIENSYMTDAYLLACKKQMVRTSIPYNLDPKELPKYNASSIMDVNQEFITGTILPFFRSLPQIVKDLSITAANVVSTLDKAYEDIKVYVSVADKLVLQNRIDSDTYRFLNKYLYKAIRMFMSLSSYLSFIMIKKVSMVSMNINEFKELHIKILRYFPDGKDIIHENVIDGSFEDTDMAGLVHDALMNDNSVFRSAISTIIRREEEKILTIYNQLTGVRNPDVMNERIRTIRYPVVSYKNACTIFNKIIDGFNSIRTSLSVPGAVFDDLIEKSGLNHDMLSRFTPYVNAISEFPEYEEVFNSSDQENIRNAVFMVFSELCNGIKNMDLLVERIHTAYEEFTNLKDMILNVNVDDDRNKETATEVLNFLHDFDSDFRQLVLNILTAFIGRFKGLSDYIDDIGNKSFSTVDLNLIATESEDDDFDDLALESELSIIDTINQFTFHELMKEYKSVRTYYDTGMKVVYEADLATSQNATNDGTSNTNNQKSQTTSPAKKGMIDRIKAAIKSFFSKSRDIMTNIVTKQSGNLTLLQAAKEPLAKLNYTGVVINVLPYEKYSSPEQIIADIDKVINNVNKLSSANINKYNSAKNLNQYLFSFMTDNMAAADNIAETMKTYYKTKRAPLNVVAYRGASAQQHVQLMCDYCISFYTSFSNDLNKKLSELEKALTTRIDALETITESVMFEADEPANNNQQANPTPAQNQPTQQATNQNAKPSVQKPTQNSSISVDGNTGGNSKTLNILKMLSTSVQMYSSGVLTSVRDRNFDYLKVLNPLIPQDVKDNVANGNTQQQNTAQTNNQTTEAQ